MSATRQKIWAIIRKGHKKWATQKRIRSRSICLHLTVPFTIAIWLTLLPISLDLYNLNKSNQLGIYTYRYMDAVAEPALNTCK